MLRLTGQPGWLRLGYSPGWVGRSASGVGPCAEYLLTGAWPRGMQIPAQFSAPLAAPAPAAGLTAQITTLQQSIQNLASQVAVMEQRLASIEVASGPKGGTQ